MLLSENWHNSNIQMSRTVLMVAFTLLYLSEINGMSVTDPRFTARFGRDQGFVVRDASESNGQDLKHFYDKVRVN